MEVLTIVPFGGGGGGGDASVAGSDTQIQYNDGGSLGASADLTWDDTAKELGVGGDINLDSGGTYETTVQVVTPTANRTISFPDATGTVGLVAGSSGQLTYNSAGAQAGLTSASIGSTDEINISLAGAASTPPVSFTGSWFTGGTATTTKPQLLIEPTGTTSTAWSTSGTGLGVNAASGFSGRLLDLQVNGTSNFSVNSTGSVSVPLGSNTAPSVYFGTDTDTGVYSLGADQVAISTNGTGRLFVTSAGDVCLGSQVGANNDGSGISIYNTNFPRLSFRNSTTGNTITDGTQCYLVDSDFYVTNNENAALIFRTDATERARIDSSGNFGIATTTPGDKLEIGGAGAGIILASPDGTRYRLTVANGGTLSIAAV